MDLFTMPAKTETRWATAENPDGVKSGASVGDGRKCRPCLEFKSGETLTLAYCEEAGVLRRIWITYDFDKMNLLTSRGFRLRIYFDLCDKPAVDVPLGDFFCFGMGKKVKFENALFASPEGRSLNCHIPMPFRRGMKMEVTNETEIDINSFFYQVDYTIKDDLPENMLYFHSAFNRENPTAAGCDFEILPRVAGSGRFLGTCVSVKADQKYYRKFWWGEGEVKIYIDGDLEYPTLCGTGTEDYICTAWGQQQYSNMFYGSHYANEQDMEFCFYRLHIADPVYFHRDIRVTIQQLGYAPPVEMAHHMYEKGIERMPAKGYGLDEITLDSLFSGVAGGGIKSHLFERCDDWSAVAYFYLDKPESCLPPFMNANGKTK